MNRTRLLSCLLLGLLLLPSRLPAQVKLGSDVLAERKFIYLEKYARVGLLTNPSGVDRKGATSIELLHKAPNVNLVALFGAEHGVYGDIPAGKEFGDSIDPATGLKVFSLYGPGPVREPTPEMLSEIDVMVYDLQDTGARSYTFISTMGRAMEACGKAGVDFMVLDRPNPLGGLRVEGPLFDPKFRSLVGYWPIPYVYGMTCGELARMIRGEKMIRTPPRLLVVTMEGWRRNMVWNDTGLRWKPTSPNVPRGDSPLYYVATGMLGEIGGVDIGIGSSRPFEYIAHDGIQADRLASWMQSQRLEGVAFRSRTVVSRRGSSKGRPIPAIDIQFQDPARAPLTPINFYLLQGLKAVSGMDLFLEAQKRGKNWSMFDKVNGSDATRLSLQAGDPVPRIVDSWRTGVRQFSERRKPWLIYR